MSSLKDRKRVKKRKLLIDGSKDKKRKAKSVKIETKEFKAGKEARATEDINCLSCMHWKECPSKRKKRDYACTRFKAYPTKSSSAARVNYDKVHIFTNTGNEDKDKGLSKEERIISKLITRTLKGSGVMAADSRIDDSDISTAPNFYTWITDTDFMGNIQIPWAKQIEHPTKMFAEWCPSRKCTDLDWWENVPVDATPGDFLDRVSFLEYGTCTKCNRTKSEWIRRGKLMPYNALAGLAGQRLGKSATAVMMGGYDLHRILKSQNPSAMYGVMSSQVLTGTFAALTFEQAKTNIWNNLYNCLIDATWFKQYHEFLKQECYRLGLEDVHQVTNTFARYRHRNIFYHVSGPSKRTMRGATRVTALIDEIGWFMQALKGGKLGQDPERMDAQGTHDALDRSLTTVRSAAEKLLMSGGNENVPMGYLYEISSPSSKNDMIMKQYEASRGSRTIYGYRMATWEGNPTITRESSIIVEAYRLDAITAQRDYAAIPPVSGNPFIKLPSLRKLFSEKRENGGVLKTVRVTNKAGQPQTSGRIKSINPYRGDPSILSIDAGSVNNSFACTIIYASDKTGKVICPFMGEVFPSHEAPVHFPDISRKLLGVLIEHYNVVLVMSDRWQNIMLLQSLEEEYGVGIISRSLKYPDFDNFRQTAIYDGNLQLPMLENKPKDAIKMGGQPGYPGVFNNQPISHLLFQLVAVNDIPNVTVMKPDGGTDDLFRALVLGYTGITDPEYAEFFENAPGAPQPHLGVAVSGVNIGGGVSMSNSVGAAVGPNSSIGNGSSSSMGALARH